MNQKINITKRAPVIIALVSTLLSASSVLAVPNASTVNDVRFTVHNLSNNNDPAQGLKRGGGRNYNASSEGQADQVCVFCHTPHNASPAVPLWNKVYPSDASYADGFRLYTSSATLSPTAKAAKLTATSESLLCLSCHDGKTAINVLHNSSYRDSSTGGGDAIINIDGTFSGTGEFSIGQQWIGPTSFNAPNLGAVRDSNGNVATAEDSVNGTNLSDDHPIGFSYTDAAASKPGQLKPTPDAGIRLFGGRIECSSCHNPHVYYGSGLAGSTRKDFTTLPIPLYVSDAQKERTPFLTVSNKGSNLCLGCHIK